jgi:hypothetical protein
MSMDARARIATTAPVDRLERLKPALAEASARETSRLPAGFTYVAQFLSHELIGRPPALIRTPVLDLQSLYDGQGPTQPAIGPDGRMELGQTVAHGDFPPSEDDLPRLCGTQNPFTARIGDFRNDENLFLAQFHVALLKLHNDFVDTFGDGDPQNDFEIARYAVQRALGWALLEDFLPHLVPNPVFQHVVAGGEHFVLDPDDARIPVEWSHALGRFGHSMVRARYPIGGPGVPGKVREVSAAEMLLLTGVHGLDCCQSLPANRVPFWPRLFDFDSYASRWAEPVKFHGAHSIDLHVVPALRNLPAPPRRAIGERRFDTDIVRRNLAAADRTDLPSGQTIARKVRRKDRLPSAIDDLFGGTDDPGPPAGLDPPAKTAALETLRAGRFHCTLPPWIYLLLESWFREDGERLGPLAGLTCAEVTTRAIRDAPVPEDAMGPDDPALRQHLLRLRDAPHDGLVRIADLLACTMKLPER